MTQEQKDYLLYCEAKFEIDEIPLSFEDWKIFNEFGNR